MSRPTTFRVALTADFYDPAGKLCYRDIGLSLLEGTAGIAVQRFAEHRPEIGPDQLAGEAVTPAPRHSAPVSR